jgi:hypothetical protein
MTQNPLKLFWELCYFPTTVFTLHVICSRVLPVYAFFPEIDTLFHFIGGVAIAHAFILSLTYGQQHKVISKLNYLTSFLFVIALTATATVIWEFAEFLCDKYLLTNMQDGLADTMFDMFLGMLGGVVSFKLFQKPSKIK